MHILEQYVRTLQDNPARVADLFAEDGYFYDGGMKRMGRTQCSFRGRAEIHAAFVGFVGSTGRICVNGNAVRYDVMYKGDVWEAIGVGTINADNKLQSFVAEVLPLSTPRLEEKA